MSSESKNSEDIEETNQETLESIETSLGAIEAQLRPSLVRQSGGRNVRETNAGMMGRSVRESIQSALGSLRSRLDTVQEEQDESTTRIDGLERRLRNAEIAHSNRIPLHVLQRELSRRQSAVTREFTHKEEEEDAPSNNRRRSSVLLASRRMAEARRGHGCDPGSRRVPPRRRSSRSFACCRHLPGRCIRSADCGPSRVRTSGRFRGGCAAVRPGSRGGESTACVSLEPSSSCLRVQKMARSAPLLNPSGSNKRTQIVISQDADVELHHQVNTLARVRTVSDQVAQADDLCPPLAACASANTAVSASRLP